MIAQYAIQRLKSHWNLRGRCLVPESKVAAWAKAHTEGFISCAGPTWTSSPRWWTQALLSA